MTTCLGKSCLFGLLCASFLNVISFLVCPSFPFGFQGGMWDLIVLVRYHYLSSYFVFLGKYIFQISTSTSIS